MEMINDFCFGIYDSLIENCLIIKIVSKDDVFHGLTSSNSFPQEIYRIMPELFPGCWEVSKGCWSTQPLYFSKTPLTFEEIIFIMTSAGFLYIAEIGLEAEAVEDNLLTSGSPQPVGKQN